MVSLGLLRVPNGGERSVTFCHTHDLGTPDGTTIIDMDNQMILKVNLEDLPDEQRALID